MMTSKPNIRIVAALVALVLGTSLVLAIGYIFNAPRPIKVLNTFGVPIAINAVLAFYLFSPISLENKNTVWTNIYRGVLCCWLTRIITGCLLGAFSFFSTFNFMDAFANAFTIMFMFAILGLIYTFCVFEIFGALGGFIIWKIYNKFYLTHDSSLLTPNLPYH